MIVIDVGAHDGRAFALPFAQDEHNIVYAIEPIPELADALRSLSKKNLNVTCAAVSDTEGAQTFYVNADKQTSSLLESDCTDDWKKYSVQLATEATIIVPVIRLDRFIEQQSIEEIDLLKIDTQGNDFAVLKGAGDAISRIKRIILEVQLSPLYKGAARKAQIIDYLEARGFRYVSETSQTDNLEENLEFSRVNRYPLSSSWSQRLEVDLPFVGTLEFPQGDHVGKLLEEGVFEGLEQAFLWLYLRSGDSFLDCGAHVGIFSCVAAKATESTGQIIAVEPNPLCFSLLKDNIASCGGNVEHVLNIGLSEKSGYAELFLGTAGMSAFSTFSAANTTQQVGSQAVLVEQRSLDDIFCSLDTADQITLAKLDVEGWEIAVLNGAAQSISDHKLPVWMVEFTEENAQAVGSSTRELRERFESFGYTVCHFDPATLRLAEEPNRPLYAYKNLYAVHDLAAVNSRLKEASFNRIGIARDIITKWDTAVEAARLQFDLKQQKKQLLEQLSQQQQDFQEEKQGLNQLGHSERQAASTAQARLESDKAELERGLLLIREKLHDVDKSRAKIIDQLHKEQSQLNSYNSRLIQQAEEEKAKIRRLEGQVQNKTKQANKVKQNARQQIESLNQEIARLQVGRVAFKQLLKSLLRRLGLSSVIEAAAASRGSKAQQSALATGQPQPKPTPSVARSPQIEQSSSGDPEPIATPDQAIQSSPTTAVVVARSLNIDIVKDDFALETIERLMSEPASVLAIDPVRQVIPLLLQLTSAGGQLVCIDRAIAEELESYGIAVQSHLADWLTSLKSPLSSWCSLLCIDAMTAPLDQHLLAGRLAPDTQLLVVQTEGTVDFEPQLPGLDSPVAQLGPVSYYHSPPAQWVDPLYRPEPLAQGQRWPWHCPPPLPEVMPSGRPWPKISIVTVSFNHGQFIEETIRSVLGQGYPNLEYIVIDGGSTDETRSILSRYDSELSYWVSEPDSGQSNALNKGFSRATGDILAWLNSDDRYLPHTLARVAIAFETYQTDIVVGGCQLIQDYRDTPYKTHRSKFPVGQKVPLPLEDLLDIENCWHRGEFFYQPEVFWTQDLWQRSGGQLDEGLFYSMDYDLWVRMAQQGATLVHSPDALALYRVHSDQKTFGDDVPYLPELKGVSDRYRSQTSKPPAQAPSA